MDGQVVTLVKIIQHISKVSHLLREIARELEARADIHDISKFDLDEFIGFCEMNNARKYEYGSKEYEEAIHNNSAAQIHVASNRHHLEYWPGGLGDMSFVDVLEMLCDWEVARQMRDSETDINKTWKTRQQRFDLSDHEIEFLRTIWEKLQGDIE